MVYSTMNSLLLALILIIISAFLVFRPVVTHSNHVPDIMNADPPARESRPMPRPRDTWNSDAPMLMCVPF